MGRALSFGIVDRVSLKRLGQKPLVLHGTGRLRRPRATRANERQRSSLSRTAIATVVTWTAGVSLFVLGFPVTVPIVLFGCVILGGLVCGPMAGAVIDLRRQAAANAARLAEEQARADALEECVARMTARCSVVAHELASPVAAIRGLSLAVGSRCLDADERASMTAAMTTEAEFVQALVDDLRALGQRHQCALAVEPKPALLGDLLAYAAAFARALPGNRPVLWESTGSRPAIADPVRIGQVLRNLLVNAVKYAPPGTPISLREVTHGERVRIDVVDRGPGVNLERAASIFDLYARGDHTAGAVEGAGLGLTVARAIVRAHGGEFDVRPTPGGGATFGFDLPLERAAAIRTVA
ncbi:MAG: sensor histidine kinase [Thermomicrobiales bacterium]